MKDQHEKIKGYRSLNQTEIDLMNRVKEQQQRDAELIKDIQAHILSQRLSACTSDEVARLDAAEPERWAAMARTNYQTAAMFLTRAVAQPTFD